MAERLVAHFMPYAKGDSEAGIILAGLLGYLGIDLNIRTCRANNWRPWAPWRRRAVVMHWSEWWKHGYEPIPGHKVPRKRVEKLRLRQVLDLRSVDGHHRVLTAEKAIRLCRDSGTIPCLEMKPSRWPTRVLTRLRLFSVLTGWPVVLMTIQKYGNTKAKQRRWEHRAHRYMTKAHKAGHVTMLLYRGNVNWSWWGPVLDGVKNHPTRGHVKNVTRLLNHLHARA